MDTRHNSGERKVFRYMIYRMSDTEKSTQIGDLMLERKTAQQNLADLTVKAQAFSRLLNTVGRALTESPETLVLSSESVDARFAGQLHIAGVLPTHQEVSGLVNAMRAERIKILDTTQALKNLGF